MQAIKNLQTLAETIREAQKADKYTDVCNMPRRLSENGGASHGLWIEFVTDQDNIYTVTLNKKKHLLVFRTFSAYEEMFDKEPAIHPTKGKPFSFTFPWTRQANKAAREQVANPEEWETLCEWEQLSGKLSIIGTCPHSGQTQTLPPKHFQLILSKYHDLDIRIVTA